MSYAKIRPRRGTAYEWSTINPILLEGELGMEFPDSGIGTGLCKFKVGDGVTDWVNLPYAFDGAAANAIIGGNVDIFHLIQLRSGTTEQWTKKDPVLAENELTFDSTVKAFKVGDGVHKWSELSYTSSEDSLNTIVDYGDESAEENEATLSDIVDDNVSE